MRIINIKIDVNIVKLFFDITNAQVAKLLE